MAKTKRKITVVTDNSGWVEPKKKVRKKRKPMTEEQKQAAAERLAKAREVRAAKNPEYGKSGLHKSIRDLPDDHQLSPKKIKQWIKTQKDLASSERSAHRQKVKGAYARMHIHEGYIKDMNRYLQSGDWICDFYGEYMEKKIRRRCIAQAYYWYGPKKGQPKFDVGVYYPMLGAVYTQEMLDVERAEEREKDAKLQKSTKRSTKQRSTRAVAKKTTSRRKNSR